MLRLGSARPLGAQASSSAVKYLRFSCFGTNSSHFLRPSYETLRWTHALRAVLLCAILLSLTFRWLAKLLIQHTSNPLAPAFAKQIAVDRDKFGHDLAKKLRKNRRIADDPVHSANQRRNSVRRDLGYVIAVVVLRRSSLSLRFETSKCVRFFRNHQ